MRRVHNDLLLTHQHEGVREGRQAPQRSLQGCVNCHAAPDQQHAQGGSEMAFCDSCHEYAAVSLECFQCHSSTPEETR